MSTPAISPTCASVCCKWRAHATRSKALAATPHISMVAVTLVPSLSPLSTVVVPGDNAHLSSEVTDAQSTHPSARRYALRIQSAGACGLQWTWSGHCAAGMPSSASSISSMPPGCDLEKAAFELVAAHQQPNAERGVGASPLTQPREGRSVFSAWLRAHTRALRLSRDFRDDARDDDLRRRPHFPGPGKGLDIARC